MEASGLSQRAFAIETGVSRRQLSYWARRLGEARVSPASIPMRVAAAAAPGTISLRSERGWTLSLPHDVPAGGLAEMLRAL